MLRRDDRLHRAQQAWLLAIGRRLKTEYDALSRPGPRALAALLEQLEARDKGGTTLIGFTEVESVLSAQARWCNCVKSDTASSSPTGTWQPISGEMLLMQI